MGTPGLVGVILSYGLIAALLLSLNVVSLWRWWIKAGAIVVTAGFVVGSYVAMNAMLGWPATYAPPERFHLLSTRIVEPDKETAADGALYLWVEELDERNVPLETPRAFQIPYDDALAEKMVEIQERLDGGDEIMGVVEESDAEAVIDREKIRIGERNEDAELTAATDTVPFQSEGMMIQFEDLPPVDLPDKGPI